MIPLLPDPDGLLGTEAGYGSCPNIGVWLNIEGGREGPGPSGGN